MIFIWLTTGEYIDPDFDFLKSEVNVGKIVSQKITKELYS